MTTQIPGAPAGHYAAARRLADAIHKAALATTALDADALDEVVGGSPGSDEVYRAAADFLVDWRADSSASA